MVNVKKRAKKHIAKRSRLVAEQSAECFTCRTSVFRYFHKYLSAVSVVFAVSAVVSAAFGFRFFFRFRFFRGGDLFFGRYVIVGEFLDE